MNGSTSRRWWALAALALTVLAVGLDAMVLSVALPTLATDLTASTSELQWFTNAYTLVLAAAMLPAGLLGDRFGRRRMLVIALAVFGLASLACAYAADTGQLIAGRALLGLGAAILMPVSMSLLRVLFDDDERPKAMTIWMTATMLGLPLGPIVGGWLLDHFWWGSVFLINVPVVVLGLLATLMLIPESRGAGGRMDLVGILISAAGLVGLTYGIIRSGDEGWTDPTVLSATIGGVVVLAGFVFWERALTRRPGGSPLVDLALFRGRGFTSGLILSTLVNLSMFGLIFALPQFFQAVYDADALGTGLRLLPVIGGLLVGARLVGVLVARFGPRATIAIGFVVTTAAVLAGTATTPDTAYGFTATWMAALGVGLGFVMPTAMNGALDDLTPERSGSGSALLQSLRQVGGTIGVAVLGAVLNATYRSEVDTTGLPATAAAAVRDSAASGLAVARQLGSADLLDGVRRAFTNGMDATLWVSGGLAVLGVGLALAFVPRRRAGTAPEADTRAESANAVVH